MYPITNWQKLKRGFTFRQLYPKSFGELAGHPHLGLDLIIPTGTPIVAPFNGEVIQQLNGKQGGLTVWFRPEKTDFIIRFMHNSKFGKKGKVKAGEIICWSGNTGSASSGAHSHLDISNKIVDIANINNFINPETFKWV
jgi:peptidoglycan LD-endopeptidase LytH